MEERREQQEPGMPDFEPSAAFAEAALAQNDDLFAVPQRVHDDQPFFEGSPHGQKLSAHERFGNGPNCWLSVHGEPHDFCAVPWDPEPTPNPSQEGNCEDAEERLLPSWEGSGVGRFMEMFTMKSPSGVNRREFLRQASFGVGAGLALPNLFLNKTLAATGENPSEFVRIGVIGTGGQGVANMRAIMNNVIAVCDVDKTHAA